MAKLNGKTDVVNLINGEMPSIGRCMPCIDSLNCATHGEGTGTKEL